MWTVVKLNQEGERESPLSSVRINGGFTDRMGAFGGMYLSSSEYVI